MTSRCPRVPEVALGGPPSAELAEHVAGCAECRAAQRLATLPVAAPSSAQLEAWLQRAKAEAVAPPVRAWQLSAGLTLAVVGGVLGLVAVMATHRPSVVPLPWQFGTVALAVAGALAVVAAFAPRGVRRFGGVLALAGVTAAGAFLTKATGWVHPDNFLALGMRCARVEVVGALPALAVGLRLAREFAWDPRRAVLLGGGVSLTAMAALHVMCEDTSWAHLGLFHLLPVVGVSACAVAVRRRLRSRTFVP